jgi:hypothetical protein
MVRTGSHDNFHFRLSEIVRLVDYIIGGINGKYLPSHPSSRRGKNRTGSTDEGRRYESRFGSQGSVDQTDRLVKQGTKENGTALHPQSFDPGSQRRHDMRLFRIRVSGLS